MAVAAAIVGLVLHALSGGVTAPFATFWRAALTNTIASPFGCECLANREIKMWPPRDGCIHPPIHPPPLAFTRTHTDLSLHFISFPLLLLVKNCKLVPVMVVGALMNGARYKPYEYAAVGLISLGVVLFMLKGKGGGGGHGHGHGGDKYSANFGPTKATGIQGGPSIHDAIATDNLWNILTAVAATVAAGVPWKELRGLLLAMMNLTIDGFTNAEQDRINTRHGVSPYYMMTMVNIWSLSFAALYLLADFAYRGAASELATVLAFLQHYPGVRVDLLSFAFANALGQVFIYSIIDDFGSLVLVTVTVTRKMITLFLSILINKHPIQWWQWLGVLAVFSGVSIKVWGGGGGHKAKGH